MTTEEQNEATEQGSEDTASASPPTTRRRTARRSTSAPSSDAQTTEVKPDDTEAKPARRRSRAAAADSKPDDTEAKPARRRTRAAASAADAPATDADAEAKPARRRSRAAATAADAPTTDADAEAKPARRRSRAAATAADAPVTDAEAKPARRRSRAAATASGDSGTAEAPATDAEAEAKPARRRTRAAATAAGDSGTAEAQPATRRRRATRQQPAAAEAPAVAASVPRLLEKLRTEVGPALMQEFGYRTPMQIPRLTKVVLNIGLGEALQNPRAMDSATRDLTAITGQRPVTTRAKKSIAGFKIREGMPIGLSVTLRGRRMYEFMDRLISSALPRIRDFRGISRQAFDGRGNYSLGIREQVIFPEIDYNSIDRIRGLQIVIVTTAPTDREGLRLLESLGMPLARSEDRERVA